MRLLVHPGLIVLRQNHWLEYFIRRADRFAGKDFAVLCEHTRDARAIVQETVERIGSGPVMTRRDDDRILINGVCNYWFFSPKGISRSGLYNLSFFRVITFVEINNVKAQEEILAALERGGVTWETGYTTRRSFKHPRWWELSEHKKKQ